MSKKPLEKHDQVLKSRTIALAPSQSKSCKVEQSTAQGPQRAAGDEAGAVPQGRAKEPGKVIMEKMGWAEGEGLGAASQGDIEPVESMVRVGRLGIGAVVGDVVEGAEKVTSNAAWRREAGMEARTGGKGRGRGKGKGGKTGRKGGPKGAAGRGGKISIVKGRTVIRGCAPNRDLDNALHRLPPMRSRFGVVGVETFVDSRRGGRPGGVPGPVASPAAGRGWPGVR